MSKSNLEKYKNNLESSIQHRNMLTEFTDEFSRNGTLNSYIEFLQTEVLQNKYAQISVKQRYTNMINKYNNGDKGDLLQSLYERVLYWDARYSSTIDKLKPLI